MTEINGTALTYCPSWGAWEIVREIASNCRDTGANWSIRKDGNNLIIQDDGAGLELKHLIVGVSEKSGSKHIGQFGEGLKLAMLVARRMNIDVEIFTKNMVIVNAQKMIGDVACLSIEYTERDEEFPGTKVVLHNWQYETFEDRFLFNEDDNRILVLNASGSILSQPKLFVQGVYVSELPDWRFGYNMDLKMNRDRTAVDEWQIRNGAGQIWAKVADKHAWRLFFQLAVAGKMERLISMSDYDLNDDVKLAMSEGFALAFGEKAVLATTENAKREAEHRGAKAILSENFGYGIISLLKKVLKTDENFVVEKAGAKAFQVKNSDLTEDHKRILIMLKKMAKKCNLDCKVIVAELPEEVGGLWDEKNRTIKIAIASMYDENLAKMIMIHEMAHAIYGTNDTTDAHVDACCKVGVMLM